MPNKSLNSRGAAKLGKRIAMSSLIMPNEPGKTPRRLTDFKPYAFDPSGGRLLRSADRYGDTMLFVGRYRVYGSQDDMRAPTIVFECEETEKQIKFPLRGSEILSQFVGNGTNVFAITTDWMVSTFGEHLLELIWNRREYKIAGSSVIANRSVEAHKGEFPPRSWFFTQTYFACNLELGTS